MNTVTESIYSGSVIVPLADVQHIERWDRHSIPGIKIITKHTRWDTEVDDWANSIWISDPEAAEFRRAWCRYRSELEADTLADLSPDKMEAIRGHLGACLMQRAPSDDAIIFEHIQAAHDLAAHTSTGPNHDTQRTA